MSNWMKMQEIQKKTFDGQANSQKIKEMTDEQEEEIIGRPSLKELYKQLKDSKRGGFHIRHGSDQYKKIIYGLDEIASAMDNAFTKDTKRNQKMLMDMEYLYQNLIQACEKYDETHDPSTDEGKYRKWLVIKIKKQAMKDFTALLDIRTDFASMTPQEQSSKTWGQLLEQVRTVHLSVEDFSQLEKPEEGQASEVYKLSSSNATVKNASGEQVSLGELYFFKPEDMFDMTQKETMENVMRKIMNPHANLSEKENAMILIHRLELDQEEKVNLTKRNVATSRVAALLGLEHLVAKSEMAEIYDKASGKTIQGNLMQKAKGEESAQSFLDKKRKESEQGKKEINVKVSGAFQRDMCSLQVLDVICGQVDRHHGNYYLSFNGDEISGLQGIDNDAAFGYNEQVASSQHSDRHDKAVYELKGGKSQMVLPYMDIKLAERIKNLNTEMLRFALKDVLKDREIKAAINRLKYMKEAIRREQEKQSHRFLEDNEWNDKTAQKMVEQAKKTSTFQLGKQAETIAKQNYFGRFMINIPNM